MLKRHAKPAVAILVALTGCIALSGWFRSRVVSGDSTNLLQATGFGTIDIDRQTSMDPVSIERITIGGQVIQPGVSTGPREDKPGTQFEADEGWLKNASIVLKNRTDKVIVWAGIELFFPDTGNGTASEPLTAYTITLGQRPEIDSFKKNGEKLPSDPNKQLLFLAPGQTLVVHLADYIDEIQDRLEQSPGALAGDQPLSRVTRVAIHRSEFLFADGMRWTDLDGFSIPDPNHPGQNSNLDRGRFFPGNPSHNWPPADAPGEARVTFQPR